MQEIPGSNHRLETTVLSEAAWNFGSLSKQVMG
jgi:hypothetical protein